MGHRSFLVDLDNGIKIFLHWGASALHDLKKFENLTGKIEDHLEGKAPAQQWFQATTGIIAGSVEKANEEEKEDGDEGLSVAVSPTATGKYTIEEHNIEKYTDRDAVDDLKDPVIEAVFVARNEEIVRAYANDSFHRKDNKFEQVFYRIDDSESLYGYNLVKTRIHHYYEALKNVSLVKPWAKALVVALKQVSRWDETIKIPYTSFRSDDPLFEEYVRKVDYDLRYDPRNEWKNESENENEFDPLSLLGTPGKNNNIYQSSLATYDEKDRDE